MGKRVQLSFSNSEEIQEKEGMYENMVIGYSKWKKKLLQKNIIYTSFQILSLYNKFIGTFQNK